METGMQCSNQLCLDSLSLFDNDGLVPWDMCNASALDVSSLEICVGASGSLLHTVPAGGGSPETDAASFSPKRKGKTAKHSFVRSKKDKQAPTRVVQFTKLPGGRFGCTICTLKFKSPDEARLHAETGLHTCPECVRAPLTNSGWSSHVLHQHGYRRCLSCAKFGPASEECCIGGVVNYVLPDNASSRNRQCFDADSIPFLPSLDCFEQPRMNTKNTAMASFEQHPFLRSLSEMLFRTSETFDSVQLSINFFLSGVLEVSGQQLHEAVSTSAVVVADVVVENAVAAAADVVVVEEADVTGDSEAGANVVVEDAEAEANVVEDAEAEANVVVEEAEASVVVEEAEAEANVVVEEAEAEANVVVDDVEAEASVVVEESEAEASVVVEDAETEASVVVEDAEDEASVVVEEDEASVVVEDAEADVEDAESEADVVVEEAEADVVAVVKVSKKDKSKQPVRRGGVKLLDSDLQLEDFPETSILFSTMGQPWSWYLTLISSGKPCDASEIVDNIFCDFTKLCFCYIQRNYLNKKLSRKPLLAAAIASSRCLGRTPVEDRQQPGEEDKLSLIFSGSGNASQSAFRLLLSEESSRLTLQRGAGIPGPRLWKDICVEDISDEKDMYTAMAWILQTLGIDYGCVKELQGLIGREEEGEKAPRRKQKNLKRSCDNDNDLQGKSNEELLAMAATAEKTAASRIKKLRNHFF